MTQISRFLRLSRMRYTSLVLSFVFISLATNAQSVVKFPTIPNEGSNFTNSESSWSIQSRITPSIDGQTIYNIRYHADGKSAIIGTTDFYLFRISLLDGSMIWKTEAKMFYQKEFDGPKIFDVSPDGKSFLSFGQTNPNVQSSERYLLIRSTDTGGITKVFKPEFSLFHSITADIDYRYPGDAVKLSREESGLAPNWILTIDSAKFIDQGKRILASYKHNMDGPHFYDRRLIVYDTMTGKKINDFQLTADPNTADWTQPAGFEIAHYQFPYQYLEKRNTILYGNAHGRIHELNETNMNQNSKISLVEEKPAGPIIYIPESDSEDLQVKDRQTIRSMAITPDGNTLYCSGGVESGYIQLYAFNLISKKEIFKSPIMDVGEILAPSSQILVLGGFTSSGKFYIVDTKKGELLFVSDDNENYIHPNLFITHPKQKEILALSTGNQIVILRPQGGTSSW
ncbi:hypothetical protein [Leptospira ellinghausenii]